MSAVLFDAEKLAIAVHRQNNYYKFHILTQTATAKILYVRSTCRGGCRILVWKGHCRVLRDGSPTAAFRGRAPMGSGGEAPRSPKNVAS